VLNVWESPRQSRRVTSGNPTCKEVSALNIIKTENMWSNSKSETRRDNKIMRERKEFIASIHPQPLLTHLC
jgi:hypothetical protein